MKKTHKKIIGLFGLILVIAVTVFAAFLPSPRTQAVNQVVDNLTVRVVGASPAINISGISSGSTVVSASQEINMTYENIEKLLTTIKYTDADGNVSTFNLLDNVLVDYVAGVSDIKFNFLTGEYSYTYQRYVDGGTVTETGSGILPHFGYGDYVLTASGESLEGVGVESSVSFSFWPVVADVTQDGSKVSIGLEYDNSGAEPGQIGKIEINIYDKGGNPVGPSPAYVIPPDNNYSFDFKDYGLESGEYTISIQAYDTSGNKLFKPILKKVYYDGSEVTPVPDTGGIMGNLNISKTDYIITGLIIFSIVGISGAVFISRHDKKVGNRRR